MTPRGWRIEWRPMAVEDLRVIVRHIGNDSPAVARNFAQKLRAKVEPLRQYPEIGPPGRVAHTRELVVHPNYIVFHRLRSDARTVEILRLKHMAQQWP